MNSSSNTIFAAAILLFLLVPTVAFAQTYVGDAPMAEDNITIGQSLSFPNKDNPAVQYTIGTQESFNGEVEYLGSGPAPRGSGFEIGKFMAHRYLIHSNGFGPRESTSEIEAGFYRVGF